MTSDLTFRVGGDTSTTVGVVSTGEILTSTLARMDLDVFTFRTNPAEIKGGQSMFQVTFGHSVFSQSRIVDVLLCYDRESFDKNYPDIATSGLVIFDSDVFQVDETDLHANCDIVCAPITSLSRDVGSKSAKNIVASGILSYMFKIDSGLMRETILRKFSKKTEKIKDINLSAFDIGLKYATDNKLKCSVCDFIVQDRKKPSKKKLIISGNQAVTLGAIASKCSFFAGYPITPASEILEFAMRVFPNFGGIAVQMEDEISAIISCIGASFTGAKAMTATSGPGFSLMMEALGLCSMVELPVVIVDCQRGGPSTGLPTKTEQSDLMQSVYGGHGEAPRIVLAPSNVQDCFYMTIKAFNLAEKYQIPVIMLSDLVLAQLTQAIDIPDIPSIQLEYRSVFQETDGMPFARYRHTESGVSKISIPGQSTHTYIATGLEHNEEGNPNYTPENHAKMSHKRYKKMEFISQEIGFTSVFGDEIADVGIISWGSSEGSILSAMQMCRKNNIKIKLLQLKMLNPFPAHELSQFISSTQKILVVELNYTGQLSLLLKQRYNIDINTLNKCDGLPFFADEIFNKIVEINEEYTKN